MQFHAKSYYCLKKKMEVFNYCEHLIGYVCHYLYKVVTSCKALLRNDKTFGLS